MTNPVDFLRDNFPTAPELLLFGPIGLIWAFVALAFAGWLKHRHRLKTGYTRKVFHFIVFFTAAALQWQSGTRAVCLFGAMTTIVIAYALLRGSGNTLYEAIAREKDAPHRTLYIVTPYCATLAGGLLSAMCFGQAAIAGMLVTGVGDAIGEPVGTRWGKHTYRVPSMRGVVSTRSYEGSAAVFAVSTLAAMLGLIAISGGGISTALFGWALVIGAISALCEAVSPHGWDNFTLQFVPTFLAWMVS
jgi:phytol kinase